MPQKKRKIKRQSRQHKRSIYLKKPLRTGMRKRRITKVKVRLKNRKQRKARNRRRLVRYRVFEPSVPVDVPQLPLPRVSHYDPQPDADASSYRRLNILYIVHQFYPDTFTGTEKFVMNIARAMFQKGHRVKVFTYSLRGLDEHSYDHGSVVHREYDYEGVPVSAYRHKEIDPSQKFEIGNPDLIAFAEQVITQEKPDILHIGHPMRGMEFMQTSLRLGVPYIVTLTDFWFICPKSIMTHTNRNLCAGPENGEACRVHCQISGVQQRLDTYGTLLKSARKVLAPSVFLASMLKYVLPDLQVEVLNHGMRYETIGRNEKIYQPGNPLVFMYAGSLAPHKGVHLILEALMMVPSERIRLKIYGAGDAAYTEKLRQAAFHDKRVELCGQYSESDIHRIYQDIDVAIVPSLWYENYPLVLHEALASNVPVLASGAGGMAEKVENDINGYTFRVGDARHLAERIKLLLDQPTLLNTFKSNMRNIPIPTVEQEANAYETIYYTHSVHA